MVNYQHVCCLGATSLFNRLIVAFSWLTYPEILFSMSVFTLTPNFATSKKHHQRAEIYRSIQLAAPAIIAMKKSQDTTKIVIWETLAEAEAAIATWHQNPVF